MKKPRLSDFDLIIFDLDGTLVDSSSDLAASANYALASQGLPTWPEDTVKGMIGLGTRALLLKAMGEVPPDVIERAIEVFVEHYEKNLLKRTRFYDGTEDLLRNLNGSALAIMSNKRERFCKMIIDGLDATKHFKIIAGPDTFGAPKPSPVSLLAIARELRIDPGRSVMIGDSPLDVQAGKAAGMTTVGLRCGFTKAQEIDECGADFIADTIRDLA